MNRHRLRKPDDFNSSIFVRWRIFGQDSPRICLLALCTSLLISACAASHSSVSSVKDTSVSPVRTVSGISGQAGDNVDGNRQRLEALWAARNTNASDFTIGIGDTIQVSALGVQELQDRTARVNGAGDVSLPLIGTVHVGGLTESEATELLDNKLEQFMYKPQVELQNKSETSRLVAVTGAVRAPGAYSLNGPQDTVRDLIERAGGLAANAPQQVLLTPGRKTRFAQRFASTETNEPGIATPVSIKTQGPIVPLSRAPQAENGNPANPPDNSGVVFIDLRDRNSARFMALPARPGDSIFVPDPGNVTVTGWVYRPGPIAVTRGMTVLQAVSACGGGMFAADVTSVKVIRRAKGNGPVTVFTVNLREIESKATPDVEVLDADVIDVPYSPARIPGYAFYYMAQGLFSFLPMVAITGGL